MIQGQISCVFGKCVCVSFAGKAHRRLLLVLVCKGIICFCYKTLLSPLLFIIAHNRAGVLGHTGLCLVQSLFLQTLPSVLKILNK